MELGGAQHDEESSHGNACLRGAIWEKMATEFFAIDAERAIGLLRAMAKPVVGIIMGSTSDWETMQHCAQTLDTLGVVYEKRVISAHRTPDLVIDYCRGADARGLKVIIAAAGGAAHLAGVAAALTALPVLGVPMESASLKGLDSLLSMVQMPGGIPVATFAIGKPGAINAALFAAATLALSDAKVKKALDDFRAAQSKKVAEAKLP